MAKKKPKQSGKAVTLILALLVLGAVVYSRTSLRFAPIDINQVQNASGFVDLTLSPATAQLSAGETTTISLNIQAGTNHATGVSADLDFDPSKLEVVSITKGDFFGNVLEEASWNNGKIKFTYVTPPASGGKAGSGKVADIVVKYKSGTPSLSFTTSTFATVEEFTSGNSLKSAADASFGPKSAASPTASPAVSPTASPTSSPRVSPTASPTSSPRTSPRVSPTASPTQPTQSPTTLAPSSITSLKLKEAISCGSAHLTWDQLNGAKAYYIDVSKNSNFTNFRSSGRLSSNASEHLFSGLDKNTTYYARIAQADTHDFPRFSPVFEFKTKADCNTNTQSTSTPAPSATPTPTPSPTPKPSPANLVDSVKKIFSPASPTPTPTPTLSPTSFGTDESVDQFGNTERPEEYDDPNYGIETPAPVAPVAKSNPVVEFFRWLTSLFSRK